MMKDLRYSYIRFAVLSQHLTFVVALFIPQRAHTDCFAGVIDGTNIRSSTTNN